MRLCKSKCLEKVFVAAELEAKTSMFFYLPPLAILLYKMGRPPKLGLVVEFDVLVNYLVLPSCNMCK